MSHSRVHFALKILFTLYGLAVLSVVLSLPHDPNRESENPRNQYVTIPFNPPAIAQTKLLDVSPELSKGSTSHRPGLKWSLPYFFPLGSRSRLPSEVAVSSGGAFLGDRSGNFIHISPSGEIRWRFHPASLSREQKFFPVLNGDILFLGADNGELYKITTAGQILSSVKLGSAITGPPVLQGDEIALHVSTSNPRKEFISFVSTSDLAVRRTSDWIPTPGVSPPLMDRDSFKGHVGEKTLKLARGVALTVSQNGSLQFWTVDKSD